MIPSTKGENYFITKVVDFGQAERNARKRDLEIESEKIRELYNNVSEVELEKAFVNPHIIYAGDKDNVNEALKAIFYKAMKMKILKELPDKLF
ncbi:MULTISPECIES: hypothetical protein [unclassified Bacillus (in: firmicutes)]|uniref:hypothetical protein n=1 Tax=unclassified Bacillus (in: firmicutes) TaxID=185979 RepID=UPI001C2D4BBD